MASVFRLSLLACLFSLLACGIPNSPATSALSGEGSNGYSGPLKIFVTAHTSDGNFGPTAAQALAAMDSICNTDANKPSGGGIYSAMITLFPLRAVSKTWVLKPNTEYYRVDGTTRIGTTDAQGRLMPPLENSIAAGGAQFVRTGMLASWVANGNDCSDFSSNSALDMTTIGSSAAINSQSIMIGSMMCNNFTARLYCAQQ